MDYIWQMKIHLKSQFYSSAEHGEAMPFPTYKVTTAEIWKDGTDDPVCRDAKETQM